MLFKRRKPPKENPLLQEINKTKNELESAYSQFENVIDPDLITCWIYQINAIQERYSFLLKQMKNMPVESSLKKRRTKAKHY